MALATYEQMIGMPLGDLSVNGSITKVIGGGDYVRPISSRA